MAILWRLNPRKTPYGLVWSIVRRPSRVAGPDIGFESYFGLIGTASTGQGSQSIAATGTIVAATAGTGQGGQTVDAAGLVKSDATGDTGQGSQSVDGFIAVALESTGDTGQGSQSAQAYGDAHTPIPFYGSSALLWRLNPRDQRFGFVYSTVSAPMRNYGPVGAELYWGSFATVVTGQGGQTIDAAGTVGAAPYVETGQGGQTVDAAASASWAPIDGVVSIGQGGQSVSGAIAQRLNATVTTRQGSQSINAVGDVDNFFVIGVGLQSATLWGSAYIYNLNQRIYPVGATQTLWGSVEAIGPRSVTEIGLTQTQWGSATVQFHTHYVLQAGGLDATLWGRARIRDALQQVQPLGWDSAEVRGAVWVAFEETPPFQVTQESEDNQFTEFGSALVQNSSNRAVYPSGFNPTAFGTAYMEPHNIYPKYDAGHVGGWVSTQFGTAWISNWNRNVSPRSWSSFQYGTPWVSFYEREIHPYGWSNDVVWYQFGPIKPDGSIPGVYHGPAYIYPVGFEALEWDGCYHEHPFFGEPKVVGGAPTISPTGWDSMDFSAEYERADYDTDDCFANDNAILVRYD